MKHERKKLPHGVPAWVQNESKFFITVCTNPKGKNQLCFPSVLNVIQETFERRQKRGDMWNHLCLLMPDHLHAILSFSASVQMKRCVADWKRYITRETDVHWQRDFFDHRLRNEASVIEKTAYIRRNPVRAGLCSCPEEWQYVWHG